MNGGKTKKRGICNRLFDENVDDGNLQNEFAKMYDVCLEKYRMSNVTILRGVIFIGNMCCFNKSSEE